MKILLVLLIIFFCGGCGQIDRTVAKITGYASQCINGVEYLQFASGVTVAYNRDGTIKQCE